MHTLVLLDIKVREQSEENMARWVIREYVDEACVDAGTTEEG